MHMSFNHSFKIIKEYLNISKASKTNILLSDITFEIQWLRKNLLSMFQQTDIML